MVNRDCAEAVVWGRRAIALAERFGEIPILVGALSSVGSALIAAGDVAAGCAEMERGLRLARESEAEQGELSILSNMGTGLSEVYRFPLAERTLVEGIAYACDRGHDGWHDYMTAWLASTRLYQGRWNEAADLARSVLARLSEMPNGRFVALTMLGRLRARRGDPDILTALDEARALAAADPTLLWLGIVHTARAEAAWLAGNREGVVTEARTAFDLALDHQHAWLAGELAYWLWRADALTSVPPGIAEPFARQIAGDWRGAAAAWDDLGCPYETARALAESDDEEALREALATFERLGARPMSTRVTRRLRDLGARDIPRGPRPATLANPAQLTPRESEILALMAEGHRNAEIADRLFLAQKTVEHHVSAVITKLGVANRAEAAREANRRGLIPQTEGSATPS
jgi:DNA-binding CsgD family transcriptional regulator